MSINETFQKEIIEVNLNPVQNYYLYQGFGIFLIGLIFAVVMYSGYKRLGRTIDSLHKLNEKYKEENKKLRKAKR